MNEMVLAALRRKRETAERAGMTDLVEKIDARLAEMEGGAPKAEKGEADTGPSVKMTPAAQARADELGLTAADFKRRRPSGQTGFTVSDVDRIAEALGKAGDGEEDTDGDD